jgi:hypothetical protein
VNPNERDEITASVAAHGELGSGYDSAVAEGLVERIGVEIDRRIEARLGWQDVTRPLPPVSPPATGSPPAYRGPVMPAPPAHATGRPPEPRRSIGVSGMLLGIGSMGLGVGATAVVVANHPGGGAATLMVLLIWAAITVINVAHSQRKL